MRVGVWSLPWRWHILSILLTAGRGINAETRGLDDALPPDGICSRPETLCQYICIYMYASFIRVLLIWRICTYTGSVVQYWWSCTPSQSIRLFWGSVGFLCWMPLVIFISFTNRVLLYDNKTVTRMIVTIGIRFKQHFDNRYFAFCNLSPPGCFCPWTFFQNIVFNMAPSDPFMSHLATQLGYSTGEFKALQLIVLVAFGVVD